MEWPRLPLAALVRRLGGGTPSRKRSEYWGPGLPWFTVADLTDDLRVQELQNSRECITEEGLENSSAQRIPAGSVVVSTRVVVGKIGIANREIATNQDFASLVPRLDSLDGRFLAYYLLSIRGSLRGQRRGLTITGITTNTLDALPVPLPPVSEQRRIVEILDHADRLRRLRAEADAKAERILPALFIKMFGDPAVLLSHPSARPLAEFGVDIQNGFACGEKDVPDGVPHLRMNNLSDTGRLDLRLVRTVPNDMASERYRLRAGDVLFMSTNSEDKIGKACVFSPPDERPYLFSNHLMRIRCRTSELTPEYLATFLHLLWRSGFYAGIAKRWVNQATVSRQALGTVRVPAFAPERQRRLAKAHHELDNHVKARVSSGERLTLLFAQLLERAFSGSLTASWREAHMKELLQEMEQQARMLETATA